MCVAVRAAAVSVAMRPGLVAVLFVSVLFMWMIMPMRAMLMAVLSERSFLVGMIMPMRLLVLVRVVPMRIVMIGHFFTSCGCLQVPCSTAKTTLCAFNQHLYLDGRHRMVRLRRIERSKYFIAQLIKCRAPVRC